MPSKVLLKLDLLYGVAIGPGKSSKDEAETKILAA